MKSKKGGPQPLTKHAGPCRPFQGRIVIFTECHVED